MEAGRVSRVARVNADLSLVRGRDGTFLFNHHDAYVGRSLELYGEYSQQETTFLTGLLKPGDVAIEAGANIGAQTVALARAVGTSGRVLAFEPQRYCFALLQSQIALNGLLQIHAYNLVLGAELSQRPQTAADYSRQGNFGGVSYADTGAAGETVRAAPLDQLVDLPRLALLKVDVEGMEAEVLTGASKTIARHKPMLYVENDRREKAKALIDLILSFGYRAWWHLPPLFNPGNYFQQANNVFGGIVSANMFCCADDRTMSDEFKPIRSPDDLPAVLGGAN